jgi:hypothetical protein
MQGGLGNGWYLLQWCCSMGDPDKKNKKEINLTTISQIFIKIYPNDLPLMTFLSSNLKNEEILFSLH